MSKRQSSCLRRRPLTNHERDAQREVSGGADEVRHSAVHPAHDVHVHRAALETSARGLDARTFTAQTKPTCEYPYQPSHAELKAKHQV